MSLDLTFRNINLSIHYDAVTVYYTFPGLETETHSVMRDYKEVNVNVEVVSSKSKARIQFQNEIRDNGNPFFKKIIHHSDPIHYLYHKDRASEKTSHVHFQFSSPITPVSLLFFATLLTKFDLLSLEEKDYLEQKYIQEYEAIMKDLETFNIYHNERDLFQLIQSYTDNEKLYFLHDYLLSKQFDSLREHETSNPIWQGMDATGAIVPTSKLWSEIEKRISLQIMQNIKSQIRQRDSGKFKSELTQPLATELQQNLKFFGIKRKSNSNKNNSDAFSAFLDANQQELDRKYRKLF